MTDIIEPSNTDLQACPETVQEWIAAIQDELNKAEAERDEFQTQMAALREPIEFIRAAIQNAKTSGQNWKVYLKQIDFQDALISLTDTAAAAEAVKRKWVREGIEAAAFKSRRVA